MLSNKSKTKKENHMKLKKGLVALLLCGGLAISSFGMTACKPEVPDYSQSDTPSGTDIPTDHTHSFGKYFYDVDEHWQVCDCGERLLADHNFGTWTIITPATASSTGTKSRSCKACGYSVTETIPKADPIYDWRYANVLQNNIIVASAGNTVQDYDGSYRVYTQLVDRAIDSTADEIATRLELVYGRADTDLKVYTTSDPATGKDFVSYNSNNSFAKLPTNKYTGYDAKGNTILGAACYPLTDNNGNKIIYDSSIHPTYVQINGTKYAAINPLSMNGNFDNALSLRYFLSSMYNTIEYCDSSTSIDSILNFANAITGSGTWEYSEQSTGRISYVFEYNNNSLTTAWNWATDYSTTAKTKLKQYIAYIAYHKITDYNNLPSENVILSSNYTTLIADLDCINFADTYHDVLYQVIANRIIGDAYLGDKEAGTTATAIAQAIYKTSTSVLDPSLYYNNGKFVQLYENTLGQSYITLVNNYSNSNFSITNYLNARNYKAYDVVITGLLDQIASNTLYNPIARDQYEVIALNNSNGNPTRIDTTADMTEIYIFSNKTVNFNNYFLQLGLDNTSLVSIQNQNGTTINYTNSEDGLILNYTLSASTTPTNNIANSLNNCNYIKITLQGAGSYQVYVAEMYVTNA